MIFDINWIVCTISVVVANLSCLALCSFFTSILPTKRNLLTHLETLLVLAMAAVVNGLVSRQKNIRKSLKLQQRNVFPVCRLIDLGDIRPAPFLTGDFPAFSPLLASCSGAGHLHCPQHHQNLPDTQGKKHSMKEFTSISLFSR